MISPRHSRLAQCLLGLSLLLGFFTICVAQPPASFDPVLETNKLLATMPAAARAQSDAYFEGGYIFQIWNLVLTLIITWGLLRWGVTVKIRNLAERLLTARYLQGLLFITLFALFNWGLTLPSDYYEGFIREHRFGLSNLTPGGWFSEQLKSFLVGTIIFSLIGSLLYLGIRKSPQRWWVRASIATPFFMIFMMVLAPVFIAPLFNKYTALTDAKVRDPILSMARANGVPADNVYQFDASKQSKRVSANVSGALNTIRVSLNDNLLNRCSPQEVQAVMGHELGHYVLNHIYKMVIDFTLLICAGFWFTHWFTAGRAAVSAPLGDCAESTTSPACRSCSRAWQFLWPSRPRFATRSFAPMKWKRISSDSTRRDNPMALRPRRSNSLNIASLPRASGKKFSSSTTPAGIIEFSWQCVGKPSISRKSPPRRKNNQGTRGLA